MASLLDRMNVSKGSGPVRNKEVKPPSRTSSPYSRPQKAGDSDSAWKHDMFDDSLSARLGVNTLAQRALADINPSKLSIKGASALSSGNVVEVSGLLEGTTRDDVKAIFSQCGDVQDVGIASKRGERLKMRVTFKGSTGAEKAKKMFDKKVADGNVLSVEVVGLSSAKSSLGGRLGADGLGLVREEGSVDILLASSSGSGSKMRSDALLNSERAQVLVAPPGADPREYTQGSSRGRGARGRGGRGGRGSRGQKRGARGGAGGLAGRMDVD